MTLCFLRTRIDGIGCSPLSTLALTDRSGAPPHPSSQPPQLLGSVRRRVGTPAGKQVRELLLALALLLELREGFGAPG